MGQEIMIMVTKILRTKNTMDQNIKVVLLRLKTLLRTKNTLTIKVVLLRLKTLHPQSKNTDRNIKVVLLRLKNFHPLLKSQPLLMSRSIMGWEKIITVTKILSTKEMDLPLGLVFKKINLNMWVF